MNKDYGSWKLAELQAELQRRNAKRTGRKATLVQRLQEYDILFGDIVNNPDVTYKVQTPHSGLFKDLNTDMSIPVLDCNDLATFCSLNEQEDIQHASNMYKEFFLLTFRVASEGSYHFVMASCAAEMKKNITCNIVIKYESHTVIEAQCECAAGVGPHAQCKHVISVLYGLIDYTENKNVNVRSSATSELQKFHHPKKFYKGEPVKAEDIKIKEKDINLKKIVNFDPRPSVSGDAKYIESFKNHCINFSALEKRPMPILQIIKPADKRALYADHDYMEKTMEEKFLQNLLLTSDDIKNLEEQTRKNNKKWKTERTKRLHSSNFGRICKVKNENKKKLAQSLLKNLELIAPAIQHGRKYEKKALITFTHKTGLEVKECGIILSDEQFLASTPDGLIGDTAVIEVKCPFTAANKKISAETINYIELCDKTGQWVLKRDHEYFYQVQGQLFCTKRVKCYFCIYTIIDFVIIEIDRDDSFINQMHETLKKFYEEYYKEQFLNRYLYK